jgi:hypothetical protein
MAPAAAQTSTDRAGRIRLFREELAELESEKVLVLSDEQRMRLEAYHGGLLATLMTAVGSSVQERARRISWGMRITTLLGALALFASVVLFLHRYWGILPGTVQIGVLVLAPLLLMGVTEFIFRRHVDGFFITLSAWAATASVVFAMDALGAVHNIAPRPHILLVLGLCATGTASAYRQKLLLAGGLLTLCAYSAALYMDLTGRFWGALFSLPAALLPAAVLVYVIPALLRQKMDPDFLMVCRTTAASLGLTAMLFWSMQGGLSFPGVTRSAGEALCEILGLLVSVGVVAHGLRLGRGALVNIGSAGFGAFLYLRLHAWWWHWMPKYVFFLCLAVIALLLLLLFRRLHRRLEEVRA